ncbi:hypothetical protein GEO20_16285 [Rhodococcus erythropolis]|nr:hypothetical protein [Rhodococcus erythropolis]
MPTENPNATLVPGKMRSDREEIPEGYTKKQADERRSVAIRLWSVPLSSPPDRQPSRGECFPAVVEQLAAVRGIASPLIRT